MEALETVVRILQLLILLPALVTAANDAITARDLDSPHMAVIQITPDGRPASFKMDGDVYNIIESVDSGEESDFDIDKDESSATFGKKRMSLTKRAKTRNTMPAVGSMNSKELQFDIRKGLKDGSEERSPWSSLEPSVDEVLKHQPELDPASLPGYYQAVKGTNVHIAKHVFVMIAMKGELSNDILQQHLLPELAGVPLQYLWSARLLYGVSRSYFALAADHRLFRRPSREEYFEQFWRKILEVSPNIRPILSEPKNIIKADSRLFELRDNLILQGLSHRMRLVRNGVEDLSPTTFEWSSMTRDEANSTLYLMLDTWGESISSLENLAKMVQRMDLSSVSWARNLLRILETTLEGLDSARRLLPKALESEETKWKTSAPNGYKLKYPLPASLRSQRALVRMGQSEQSPPEQSTSTGGDGINEIRIGQSAPDESTRPISRPRLDAGNIMEGGQPPQLSGERILAFRKRLHWFAIRKARFQSLDEGIID